MYVHQSWFICSILQADTKNEIERYKVVSLSVDVILSYLHCQSCGMCYQMIIIEGCVLSEQPLTLVNLPLVTSEICYCWVHIQQRAEFRLRLHVYVVPFTVSILQCYVVLVCLIHNNVTFFFKCFHFEEHFWTIVFLLAFLL